MATDVGDGGRTVSLRFRAVEEVELDAVEHQLVLAADAVVGHLGGIG